MTLDPTAIAALVTAGAGVLVALAAFRNSRTARQDSASRVTKEAFDTAKELWQVSVKDSRAYIDQLRFELTETKKELVDARLQLETASQILSQEKTQRQFLQIQVDNLQLEVRRLQMKLRDLGESVEADPDKEM